MNPRREICKEVASLLEKAAKLPDKMDNNEQVMAVLHHIGLADSVMDILIRSVGNGAEGMK